MMTTIPDYIQTQDENVRPLLQEVYACIRAVIRGAIPEAEETISWSMPTYRKGRNIIHFAAASKHIGLYPGPDAIVAFADRLKGYKTSKGTVQIPLDSPLQLGLIADLARWSYEHNRK